MKASADLDGVSQPTASRWHLYPLFFNLVPVVYLVVKIEMQQKYTVYKITQSFRNRYVLNFLPF